MSKIYQINHQHPSEASRVTTKLKIVGKYFQNILSISTGWTGVDKKDEVNNDEINSNEKNQGA